MLATDNRKLRAKHHSWSDVSIEDECFADIVSLDPREASAIWKQLATDTFEREVAAYPELLHRVLLFTLRGGK